MNVSVENLAPCKKLVRVEVDAQKVDDTFEAVTREYLREARFPGFRPGKAPRDMVLRKFAKDIEDETKRKLVNEAYHQAIDEQKLDVLGKPDIEEIQFGRGQPLQFAATVETAPDFELPEYKGLPVEIQARVVTDADMDRALMILRERRVGYQTVDRPLATGDVAVVNYTGTCEGKPITDIAPTAKGLTEKRNFWVEAGAASFIPGFADQLLGAKAGDKRTITVDFPADFVTPQLAGKRGLYEVELVEVKQKGLPPLDDALAQAYGAENLEKLREGVRRDLENEAKFQQSRAIEDQVLQALGSRVQFELPESALAHETKHAVDDLVATLHKRGASREQIVEQKDQIAAAATHNAREGLKLIFLLRRIAEKEKIGVSEQEIAARITEMAAAYKVPPEKLAQDLKARNALIEIYDQIMNRKVRELLAANAKIIETAPGAAPGGP